MAAFPISLDNLINYVKSLHPGGGPLEELSGAILVGSRIEEQSDMLIGHFVDQARRSGASWSQIGEAMGVTKQAAQKRYVLRDRPDDSEQLFARFTLRARRALAAAGRVAATADDRAGGGGRDGSASEVDAAHLAVGLLAEPAGVAAKIIHSRGITDDQFSTAFGLAPTAPADDPDATVLRELPFTDAGKAALRGALKSALRLGHNYIGTEHLLLGIAESEGDAAATLAGLHLDAEFVERELVAQVEALRSRLHP